ncbi:MAG: EAL domain-containing protein [Cyanobacteria bacterium P01_A01_bin.135]
MSQDLPLVAAAEFLQQVVDHLSTCYEELEQQNQVLEAHNQSLATEKRRYKLLFDLAPDGYLVTDTDGTILLANRAIATQLNMADQQLISKPLPLLLSATCRAQIYSKLQQIRRSDDSKPSSYRWDLVFCRRGRNPFDAAITLGVTPKISHSDRYLLWLIRDVTQQRQLERQIEHLAFHDALTGLPNRRWFNQHLGDRLSKATHSITCAVAIVDVDHFKQINDTYGHGIGDALLKAFATRLSQCLAPEESLCRWAGDEFAMIMHHSADRLAHRCEEILEQLRAPFHIEQNTIQTTGSLGVARCRFGDGVGSVLGRADVALYQAKRKGRDAYCLYQSAAVARQVSAIQLERDLRRILGNPASIAQQLSLYFQPQVDCTNHKIIALEALVRWQHPQWGLLYPSTFIDLAEASDLIVALGEWTLREGLRQAKRWRSLNAPPVLAVNMSPWQFQQPNLAAMVQQCLVAAGFSPRQLELEITETLAMNQPNVSQDNLSALSKVGVNIALDDFGTGYSSFARLKQLPINTLKIDRSLVADLEQDPDDAIVAAIVALAQGLDINLVAEGVETPGQMQALQALGCQRMQGYLFSPAIPGEQVPALLTSDRAVTLHR